MKYTLRVSRQGATPQSINLEAVSHDEARIIAEREGYLVLEVKQSRIQIRKHQFPLLLFCQELTVLLDSGLLLTEGLLTLSKKEKNIETQSVIDKLLSSVQSGHSFSDALSEDPVHFPTLFVAMVRACETTGNLSEGLGRFAQYLEHVDVLKKKLISASIYPSLILGMGLLVLLFLLGYVVPRFSQIYESRDTELSFASGLLLTLGNLIQSHGMLLLLVLVSVIISVIVVLNLSPVRAKLGQMMTKLPKIGERIFIYHLSRFYRTFAMLLRSGIPVVPALNMVSELLGKTLETNVSNAKQLIIDGQTFTQSMDVSGLLTPVAEQLFQVGERSGNLDMMMERAAEFHEEEMMRWVDAFSKVVEPLLMALLGVVIGGIVFLMYLPIFELASGLA